jgi:hypothetical protein
VALVRTNVSEELSASFIKVSRIGEVGTTLAVTSKRLTQQFFDSCHLDDGGPKFFRNVGSYKSHTALTSQKTPFFNNKISKDAVLLDIEKAFNTNGTLGLLYKLNKLEFWVKLTQNSNSDFNSD